MQSIPPSRRRKIRTWALGPGDNLLQSTAPTEEQKILIDLASNDYLGLSRHPDLIEAATSTMNMEGVGAGGSRLVTGSRPIHCALEEELANWLGKDKAYVFPSGFQANLAAVIALANRNTTVIADRLIHHSLLVGAKASGARIQRFSHNNLSDLEIKLSKCLVTDPKYPPLVITESVFSMEGTSPSLIEMDELCEKYGAIMLVDEAHAIGVMGPQGKGLAYGISGSLKMISGTFGKAFGAGGAFLACSSKLGENLLQTSGAFRYTTALAPPIAAASLAALNLIKANPHWCEEIQHNAEQWRNRLASAGWARPPGNSQIISLLIGNDQKALSYQAKLETANLLSVAIRPPTVPEGTARLRIVIHRNLPNETLEKLIEALKNL